MTADRPRRAVAAAAVFCWVIVTAAVPAPARAADDLPPRGEWVYLDNGEVRLGVRRTSAGAIGYFGPSKSRRNLINHHDQGRLVQQSYYGNADGSTWAGKPWRWNPVQGGDYRGPSATLLDLRADKAAHALYARTMPKHWATGADLPEVTLEQWVTLAGKVAHVRYKFAYAGHTSHDEADQEIPAVFVDPALEVLVRYDGAAPWSGGALTRSRPGWPNEYHEIGENWAAYVGADGAGVGAYVPAAGRITAYRFGEAGRADACSYFAPLTRFAVTPGFTFQYDLYLAAGTVAEMRETFRGVRDARAAAEAAGAFAEPFSAALKDGWSWVRGDEQAWRIKGGQLWIRPASGTLWEGDNTGGNLLVRPAPPPGGGPYAVELTVTGSTGAKEPGLYEQAGLVWYGDDDNYVKLVREFYDGRWWVVLAAERGGKPEYKQTALDAADGVRLRLAVGGGRVTGSFTAAGATHAAGEFDLPAHAEPRVGLLAQTGPEAPDRRVGFDDFEVKPDVH
jgi:regulation of enolase protein 1 (concanavalin A-like superfamily)